VDEYTCVLSRKAGFLSETCGVELHLTSRNIVIAKVSIFFVCLCACLYNFPGFQSVEKGHVRIEHRKWKGITMRRHGLKYYWAVGTSAGY